MKSEKEKTMCRNLFSVRSGLGFCFPVVLMLAMNATGQDKNPVAAKQDEVIVDNTDSGFSKEGDWTVSTKVPGFVGKDYLWHRKGDGKGTAKWMFAAPQDGRWQVEAIWTWGLHGEKDRATNAPFRIICPGGSHEVRVNMADKTNAARFNVLGACDLKKGDTVEVVLTNDADNSVVADAVKLVRLPPGKIPR